MTPDRAAHLTEEALNDLLLGMAAPASEAHLAVCAGCRARVEEFQSGMRQFNEASLAWSEARAASSRPAIVRPPSRLVFAGAGLALAAAVLLALGVPVWKHSQSPVDHSSPAMVQSPSRSLAIMLKLVIPQVQSTEGGGAGSPRR